MNPLPFSKFIAHPLRAASVTGILLLFPLCNSLAQSNTPVASISGPVPKSASALTQSLRIVQNPVGKGLQSAFIWTDIPKGSKGVAVVFRKSFDLKAKPSSASLHLFADARFILWVNGTYVDRGPARFQPNGPEYDTINIARFLKPGKNVVALLVVGNLSGGKVMRHEPGLTASLEIDGKTAWVTDESWRWSEKTRFRTVGAGWANLGDTEVDARVEDGDWTKADYDDGRWKHASRIAGDVWGPLTARRIPMLRETPVPIHIADGKSFPLALKAGEKLEFTTDRIVQAYPVITINATAGTEVSVEPFGLHYIAKEGVQTHFTIDTRGLSKGAISVKSGQAAIISLKLFERLYPFDCAASFSCSDPFLNKLWAMCARSCQVLSEDSYVDCADRERVEWMDDTPPGYDITRTAMAGPAGVDGKTMYGDSRLLGELIRRTALTLQPDGWVKAHTCSDRFDIHAKMEDRACDWVEGVRLYEEATGDTAAVKEIWPAIVTQLDYFLKRRTERGLVRARDWVVWGNPVGYLTGEGTTLNLFVCRALEDAAKLGALIGEKADEERFGQAARELKQAINTVLWDEKEGTYYAGYFTDADLEESKRKAPARINNLVMPTLHSSIFALDRGVVPPERRKRVISKMIEQDANGNARPMTYYYLAKQLYALDQTQYDQRVLDIFRGKWAGMAASPWQCSWEEFGGGSHAHIYGMFPGYLMSAYVLGVRRDAPVAEKQLLIEPHLGDLIEARGTVVTEFGLVKVSWEKDGAKLGVEITLPEGPATTLALPLDGVKSILMDGKDVPGEIKGNRLCVPISSGKHVVSY